MRATGVRRARHRGRGPAAAPGPRPTSRPTPPADRPWPSWPPTWSRPCGGADAQARALVDVHADVVCVIECTDATVGALDRAGLADRLPFRSDDRDPGWFGSLVASRHPITRRWTGDLGGRPGHWVDLDVAGVEVRVVAVHTQAPIFRRDVAVWHSTIAAAAALADGAPGPVVLAGDWNATRRAPALPTGPGRPRPGRRPGPAGPSPVAHLARGPPGRRCGPGAAAPRPRPRGGQPSRWTWLGLERLAIPACDHLAVRAALRLPAP